MDALIVDDILDDFVYGKLKSSRAASIIPKTKRLISAARHAKVPVIYVCDAHLDRDPEIKVWGPHAMKGSHGARVVDELKPRREDYVLEKRTYSSFHETGLDLLLRDLRVDSVVIVGRPHRNSAFSLQRRQRLYERPNTNRRRRKNYALVCATSFDQCSIKLSLVVILAP